MAANESDATALLKKNILNGNLGKFQVVTIFDVLEGMYFNLILFLFLFFVISFLVNDIPFRDYFHAKS